MKRFLFLCLIVATLVCPVKAEPIKWVDFQIPYESLKYAMDTDIATFEQEKHLSMVDILALAACRTGGKCSLASVKKAVSDLKGDKSPEELLDGTYKYYGYYREAYSAALGGLLGTFEIKIEGKWQQFYGLKATHCTLQRRIYHLIM